MCTPYHTKNPVNRHNTVYKGLGRGIQEGPHKLFD
jgi:acid stress-induced BolA-like protein IbaG/YrbA